MANGLFKLNGMNIAIKANNNNNNIFSDYAIESSYNWHGRLGYINYHTLCRLINLIILHNININLNNKYEIMLKPNLLKFYSIQ